MRAGGTLTRRGTNLVAGDTGPCRRHFRSAAVELACRVILWQGSLGGSSRRPILSLDILTLSRRLLEALAGFFFLGPLRVSLTLVLVHA